ncbi:hypothetical protein N3K63_08200 [Microbacterium sp. W1N]|uniref:hypothetical protein n=1 Tax=Microbacterium festucae TaxID=2977531 RepID=UPI0021BF7E76|nr:hypothetical protein [Microbacterium festucae]MCT9820264.1 hypothetical protein [Microbacterium festucae]
MSPRLLFPHAPAAADALTFAQRAGRAGDGAVRLRAEGGVLAMTASVLAADGLLDDTPTILAMRFLPVDPELVCDLVVTADALTPGDEPTWVGLPEAAVTASWAGISPPRSGWEPAGEVAAATLAARAQWGIAAVAEAVPTDAGAEAVQAVRAHVWGVPDDALLGLPRGVAFAAFALGFIGGEETAAVRRCGPWTRLSLARGHVITRETSRVGMTAVRTTGRSA